MQQIAVEASRCGAAVLLHGLDLGEERVIVDGDAAHEDVRVAAKVLGHRVHHQVQAVLQGALDKV